MIGIKKVERGADVVDVESIVLDAAKLEVVFSRYPFLN